MRSLLLFVGIICSTFYGRAQYQEVARFTTAEGLPSNHIYHCVEDNQGFLWVATDQGLARFDGKHFQVFTTANGLPDNEVLEVVKEKTGRLWVSCFKQVPTYFDLVKNRFIKLNIKSSSTNEIGTSSTNLFALPDGGVTYRNNIESIVIKNNAFSTYPFETLLKTFSDGTELIWRNRPSIDTSEIQIKKAAKILDKVNMPGWLIYYIQPMVDNKLYISNGQKSKWIQLSNFRTKPLRFDIDTLDLHSPMSRYSLSRKYIIAVTKAGAVDIYDQKSFTYLFSLYGDYKANNAYGDSKGNIWVCTMDKGLILYRTQKVVAYNLQSPYYSQLYLSIARLSNGVLFLGGNNNEIIESNSSYVKKHILKFMSVDFYQRNIINSQGKLFICNDLGILVDFRRWLKAPLNKKYFESKAIIALNDSIFISGDRYCLYRINSRTEHVSLLKEFGIRVTSIASIQQHEIYFGSTNGLYKYDIHNDSLYSFNKTDTLLGERIVALCTTTDSILWIATASNGVFALRNDKMILHITEKKGLLTNRVNSIISGKIGQIWIGTNQGISLLNYRLKHQLVCKSIINISVCDGLTSNNINQMVFQSDTLYAATNRGISLIPSDIVIPKFNIPIFLTNISINQHDTDILNQYALLPTQNNISLQFAGVELSGHFDYVEYSMNYGKNWSEVDGLNLNLQLGSGLHNIWLRAVDINRQKSNKILKLKFVIATPFWKSWWFLSICSLLIVTSIIAIYARFVRKKHQAQIQDLLHQQQLDDLEIQALKAQINPHFVFNCLSSIRGFVYDEDFKNADIYLQKFSQLLRSTLQFSGQPSITLKSELEYIETYISLEKLRFDDRFEYEINVNEELPQQEIAIPAMILQPFVENAIHHGIGNRKDKSGKLIINAYLVGDELQIRIHDNGIGRSKANEINKRRINNHHSRGIQLTERRIELYQIKMEIIDLVSKSGQASGTLVSIKIPIPLKS